jgi:hypothetical protein
VVRSEPVNPIAVSFSCTTSARIQPRERSTPLLDSVRHEAERAQVSGKARGLRDRLRSHGSGIPSGDQFDAYVLDRLVLPALTSEEIEHVAAGRLSLDLMTRQRIHRQLYYRFGRDRGCTRRL